MKLLFLALALVGSAAAQFGNATRIQGQAVKSPLACSDTYVLTWVAATNRFECLAGGGGGAPSGPAGGSLAGTYPNPTIGTLGQNLLFTDATYDIGASGATRPRDYFGSRDVTVGRNLTAGTSLSVDGTMGIAVTSKLGNAAFSLLTGAGKFSSGVPVGQAACADLSNAAATCSSAAIGGITGMGSGVGTFLVTPSSANLAAAITDETGSGAAVFANTPTLVTPVLGAATGTSLALSGALTALSVNTSGGGVGGALGVGAGTSPTIPANSFGFSAPGTITTSQFLQPPNAVAVAHSLMVIGAPSSNVSAFAYKAVPDCTDTGGNHLNFTQSTDAFSCGTSGASLLPLHLTDANTVEQYNSTTAQTLNLYNTRTDASNYERGFIRFNGSNRLQIGFEATGSGVTTRNIDIGSNPAGNPTGALNLQGTTLTFFTGTGGITAASVSTTGIWSLTGLNILSSSFAWNGKTCTLVGSTPSCI